MVFLEFEDLDFSFMLEKHNVVEKQFVCLCNSLSGKMFKINDFMKIIGEDFGSLEFNSPQFDVIIPRQELKCKESTILTVFSNLDIPEKTKKEDSENFKIFLDVCDILNRNIFIRSVVGEYIQRRYHFNDLPFFLKKEHKSFKIEFINKIAFSTLFYQFGLWNFDGKFAEFSWIFNPRKRSLDEYQESFLKFDSNFDYCCYLLLNSINNTNWSYDPWMYYKKELQRITLTDPQELAVSIFLLSHLYLLRKGVLRVEDNEENYSIKEVTANVKNDSKSNRDVEAKKQEERKSFVAKDNPKFRPDERTIFLYWNTKKLRKHKDATTKGISSFISFYRNSEKYIEKSELSVQEVQQAIDMFEQMVNDPEVHPTNPRSKEFLKKFGLNDFFYHPRSGRSILSEILQRGIQTRVQPYSVEMFDKVCLIIQRGTKGVGLSTKNKNLVATFTNKAAKYLEDNKSRLTPGSSYTKIITESIRELFERKKFSFLFIISEEFFINYFPKFCFERGFIKKKSENKVMQYINPDANKYSSNLVSKEKEETSELQKMMELRKQNAGKSGKFSKN